jgi:hypothetical protein
MENKVTQMVISMNGMMIDVYSEYGSIWHLHSLIVILNSSHKDSGCNLHNWMFI